MNPAWNVLLGKVYVITDTKNNSVVMALAQTREMAEEIATVCFGGIELLNKSPLSDTLFKSSRYGDILSKYFNKFIDSGFKQCYFTSGDVLVEYKSRIEILDELFSDMEAVC